MCMQLNAAPGVKKSNFLYKGDEVGKGMIFYSLKYCRLSLITGFTVDLIDFPQVERVIIEKQLFASSTIHSLQWHNTVDTSTTSTLAPFKIMNDAYHFFTHAVC